MTDNESTASTTTDPACRDSSCKYWEGSREWRREMRRRDPLHGLFWSLLLILLGGLFLAGAIYHFDLGEWWPLILIAVGVASLTRFIWRKS